MKDLKLDEHLGRSEAHHKLGKVLAEVGHEWTAVALFYSAYHLVRHGLRTDPIFDMTKPCFSSTLSWRNDTEIPLGIMAVIVRSGGSGA